MKQILKKIALELYRKLIAAYEADEMKKSIAGFKSIGSDCSIQLPWTVKGASHISIGNHFNTLARLRIEAWDSYGKQQFNPSIHIGDNVSFNTDVHIGCINQIYIGDGTLIASRVYISDHSHGDITKDAICTGPALRPLISKGPVRIGKNVWIGEGVSILPGVTIGDNTIIGANSTITKNFPANAVVAGSPARIIKILE